MWWSIGVVGGGRLVRWEVVDWWGGKHLGLTLDSKLTFSKHINDKIIMRFLSSYLPLHTLIQIYKMYIRPHVDYCDIIYHIPPLWPVACGLVVSMFDFHRSDRGSNPGRGGEFS